MKRYVRNSPESIARVVAMMMVTDGKLDSREIEILDELHVYEILGMSQAQFMEVVHEYCSDLLASSSRSGHVKLIDQKRIDEIIDCVDNPPARILACSMILNVAHADKHFADTELAVFRHVLERWNLTLEELHEQLRKAA